MPVVEADEFRPEAKRESQHLHAGPAGHQEMAQLMEENDNRQHEQEGNDVANKAVAQRIETMKKKLGHPIPPYAEPQARPLRSKIGLRQFEARGWQPCFALDGQRRWHRPRTPGLRDCRNVPSRSSSLRPAAQWRQT